MVEPADAFGYIVIAYEESPVKDSTKSNRRSDELPRGMHWSMKLRKRQRPPLTHRRIFRRAVLDLIFPDQKLERKDQSEGVRAETEERLERLQHEKASRGNSA